MDARVSTPAAGSVRTDSARFLPGPRRPSRRAQGAHSLFRPIFSTVAS
jgi:hypothetical protein